MEVDEADAPRARELVGDDRAEGPVRPGGRPAAVEDAVGMVVLAQADYRLIGVRAVLGDIAGDGRLGLGPRRPVPVGRHHQMVDGVVFGVRGARGAVIDEVPVEVDIVLVDPAQVGKAVRIDGVHQHHGQAGRQVAQVPVAQQPGHGARAAEALDPVGGRGGDEHGLGIGRAGADDVGEERLAPGSGCWALVRRGGQPRARRGVEELAPRLGVAGGEMVGRGHGPNRPPWP